MANEKYKVTVRFRDLDALGHVNYSTYLNYLEDALNQIWAPILVSFCGTFKATDLGLVTVHAEINYRSPAVYNEELEIDVQVSSVGGASFTTLYRVVELKSQRVIADAKTIQVVTLGEKAKQMPGRVRGLLEELLRE